MIAQQTSSDELPPEEMHPLNPENKSKLSIPVDKRVLFILSFILGIPHSPMLL